MSYNRYNDVSRIQKWIISQATFELSEVSWKSQNNSNIKRVIPCRGQVLIIYVITDFNTTQLIYSNWLPISFKGTTEEDVKKGL